MSYFRFLRKRIQWAVRQHICSKYSSCDAGFFPQHPSWSSLLTDEPGIWNWLVGTRHLGKWTAGEMSCKVDVKVTFEPLCYLRVWLLVLLGLWLHDKTLQLGEETGPFVCCPSTYTTPSPLDLKDQARPPGIHSAPMYLYKIFGIPVFPQAPNIMVYRLHYPKDE